MTRGEAQHLGISAALVGAVALLLIAATALSVRAFGAGPALRSYLDFSFPGLQRSPDTAIRIAAHNGLIAATPLLGAAVHPHVGRRARWAITAGLALLLVINAMAIGAVMGAYGRRALAAITPHGPMELLAFSIAGGAYLHACRHRVAPTTLAGFACLAATLLVVGAVLEVITSVGGGSA